MFTTEMTMIKCPQCGVEDRYYYDGVFIECSVCKYREWAKIEVDGHLTHLADKWDEKEKIIHGNA